MPSKAEWAASSLRSGFGAQPTSNKASAPAAGFGSSVRDAHAKLYASAEADKAKVRSAGGDSRIGAAYNVPSTLDKQVVSTIRSPPKPSFGVAKRPDLLKPSAAPGPGAYKLPSTVGQAVESTRASAGRVVFGNASRDAAQRIHISHEHEKCQVGYDSPGPASYGVQQLGAMGKQPLSNKKSAGSFKMPTGPRFVDPISREAAAKPAPGAYSPTAGIKGGGVSFGSGSRDAAQRIYISAEHEKGQVGYDSPGPAYSPTAAIAKLSTKRSSPTAKFGTGPRLPTSNADSVPGPGAYYA